MEIDEVTRVFHEANRYRNDHLRKTIGGDTLEKARSKSGRYADTPENRKWGIVNVPYKMKVTSVDKMTNPQRVNIDENFKLPSGKELYIQVTNGQFTPVKFVDYNSSTNSAGVILANGKRYNTRSGMIFCIADVKQPKISKRKANKILSSTTPYDGGVSGTAKRKEEFGKKLAQTGEHNEKD